MKEVIEALRKMISIAKQITNLGDDDFLKSNRDNDILKAKQVLYKYDNLPEDETLVLLLKSTLPYLESVQEENIDIPMVAIYYDYQLSLMIEKIKSL
jgi:hypothetical protein